MWAIWQNLMKTLRKGKNVKMVAMQDFSLSGIESHSALSLSLSKRLITLDNHVIWVSDRAGLIYCTCVWPAFGGASPITAYAGRVKEVQFSAPFQGF